MKLAGSDYIDLSAPTKNETISNFFDWQKLYTQRDLDIKAAAESNPALTVGAYGEKVSRLVTQAPDIERILHTFAVMDFNLEKKDYKRLGQMIGLLQELKCEMFMVDFLFLKNAHRKKCNWETAGRLAEQIEKSFSGFYKRIKLAGRPKNADFEAEKNIPLQQLVERLEKADTNRKLVVLAVDDSPVILKAVNLILKDTYKVILLPDPSQLENLLKSVTPELFILDYRMPAITGFDLIPIIRGFAEHKDTPIIFLTGECTIDQKSAAIMLGASDFLSKPIEAEKLKEIVAQYIKKKTQSDL